MDQNLFTKIHSAKSEALFRYPPIYTVMLRDVVFQESIDVQTMAYTGRQYLYNPEFVAKTDEAKLRDMLLHDALHVISGQPWQRFTQAKNSKVQSKFHTKLDSDVAALMITLNTAPISGGQHDHWPTLEKIFNEMDSNFEPWLKITDVYVDTDAKIIDIAYPTFAISYVHIPHYMQVSSVSMTTDRAFMALKDGVWQRVSKHDHSIRELIEAYNMAGTLLGDGVRLSTRTKKVPF